MKTIGFVDYYLGEWHADNYPAWIRQANAALGEDFTLAYAWAELDRSPVNGVTTEEWCAQNGVQRCRTLSELCEKAEYILVLAPSDPEKHLGYAREVLRYRKNTYIDKTFAPDYATAAEIFTIAQGERHTVLQHLSPAVCRRAAGNPRPQPCGNTGGRRQSAGVYHPSGGNGHPHGGL